MNEFSLVLVDPKPQLAESLRAAFEGLPRVEIVTGRFEDLPRFDCMVSAANSFGLMDGGVDAAITQFFGAALMERVQRLILDQYRGEQPVGTSFIAPTDHPKHPYLAHTPTMRVPMEIARTDHVYLAMSAMLLAVQRHNESATPRIGIVACPGLGTATGRVSPAEAARQMSLAYRYFLNPPKRIDWTMARARQDEIWYGGDLGCQVPKPKSG